MLNTIREQNKLTFSPYTLLGFIFVFITFQFVWSSYEWLFEKIAEPEDYFIYYGVEVVFGTEEFPDKKGFLKGEYPRFKSNVEYFKDTYVRWEDTLYCKQNGFIDTYDTQFWPEGGEDTQLNLAGRKSHLEGVKIENIPTWVYDEEKISPDATECYMHWKAIGYTWHGHKKPITGVTDWFLVNQ